MKESLLELNFGERFVKMYTIQKWFFHDLTLLLPLIIGLIVLLFLILLAKKKEKSFFPATIGMVILTFLVTTFVLVVFTGGTARNELALDSSGKIVEKNKTPLLTNKIVKKVYNGTSNGVSSSNSYFQLSTLNLETGQSVWINRSNWWEKIIGNSKEGILLLNTKKSSWKLVRQSTGKTILTSKNITEMKNNWSESGTDYFIDEENYFYTYGLDGKYYIIDLVKKTAKAGNYSAYFKQNVDINPDDTVSIEQLAKQLNTDFFNGSYLREETQEKEQNVVFIFHTTTRKETSLAKLTAVDIKANKIKWSISLGVPFAENSGSNTVNTWQKDNHLFLASDGYFFSVQIDSGKKEFVYDYAYNEKVQ